MDAAVFFLSCHLQLLLFANIFVARRRTANIRAERHQRRALLMRSRQQRLRAYQEGCGRRRFQFMSAMLMLRPQPTTRRFWTFPRMNDLWQDALTNWDYGLWMNNMRMSLATFTFIVVQLTPVLSRDNTNMRTSIVVGKRVMITLYRLHSFMPTFVCLSARKELGQSRMRTATFIASAQERLVARSHDKVERTQSGRERSRSLPITSRGGREKPERLERLERV